MRATPRWRPTRAVLCSVALALILTPRFAAARALPADAEVKIILTALAYDNRLAARYGELRIGVVSNPADAHSRQRAAKVLETLERLTHATIRGLRFTPIAVEVSEPHALEQLLAGGKVNVLYLAPELGSSVDTILAWAGRQKVLTLTGEESYVRAGAILGVTMRGNKPKVLLNLRAAKRQGADFDFRLLRLAEVIQ